MKKLVYFQLVALIVIVITVAFFFGRAAAISALLGGLCYMLPTGIMVWLHNLIQKNKKNILQAQLAFIVGQSSKIFLAIILMCLSFALYSELSGIYFIIGFIAVSKFIYLVFWKFGHYGDRH
ncbi:ATP synthase subunit I [Neisseria sp. Ec49-e6-T10]|uniref:ATP synthase subunit I n=1 Tax=Neisseria sp. Ec49-e6-T10 TaxID=3140744 RepID=UPI003EB9CE12